jgi:hypothetical protein
MNLLLTARTNLFRFNSQVMFVAGWLPGFGRLGWGLGREGSRYDVGALCAIDDETPHTNRGLPPQSLVSPRQPSSNTRCVSWVRELGE